MLLKKKDKVTRDYDVIVIGSGLAGMTAANKLAMAGRSVLLLEAHNKLGGFATWFRRKQGEHVFDISLHGFPVGMVKTCRKYWSREIADRIVQLKDVRFINPQYQLQSDFTRENFSKLLVEEFGAPEKSVEGFFNELENMNFYDNQNMTNGELFQKFFPDRNDIQRFLLEPITYANGSTLEDPAISYGIVFSNFMSKGVYIFKGGTDVLIDMMKKELIDNGVDIKLHTRVDQINVDYGEGAPRVNGVILDGELIRAGSVISNSNLKSTVFKMVGKEHFPPGFVQKTEEVRLNTSSCQVYMGLRKGETLPEMGDLIFYSEDETFSTDGLLNPAITSQTFSVYYPDTRPHLDDRHAIVSSSNSRWEDWDDLDDDEYERRKEFLIKRAYEGLEKICPGITAKIDHVEAATPRTVKRYTLHERGASFGTKFEGLDVSMNMHKFLPGMFHAGSVGIIMSGWLGAANYGVIQAHEVDTYLDKSKKRDLTLGSAQL